MDAPLDFLAPRFVHTFSEHCALERGILGSAAIGAPASALYPAANRAYYFPFILAYPARAKRLFVANGSAVSGNFDIGIYSLGGARLCSAGSTGQAGTSQIQYVTLSPDILLPPGAYYLAFVGSTAATAQYLRYGPSQTVGRQVGIMQEASALPLPASMTPVQLSTSAYIPLAGFTSTVSGF